MGRQAGHTQYEHNDISSISIDYLLFRLYRKQQFTLNIMNVYDYKKSSQTAAAGKKKKNKISSMNSSSIGLFRVNS